MKKSLFFLLVLSACSPKTKEEKAKVAIKEHLSKTMHDFKSYEPVEYGKVDSTFTTYASTERFKRLTDSISSIEEEEKKMIEEAKNYLYNGQVLSDAYMKNSI